MTTSPIEKGAAEASPAADRTGALPSEPAEARTDDLAGAHTEDAEAAGDVTDLSYGRGRLAWTTADLVEGFGGLESMRAFHRDLDAAYSRALVAREPQAVWERLLLEARLVASLVAYLEARA